jgi:UrcA family protein
MNRRVINVRQGVLIALSALFAATAASAADTQVSGEVTVQADRPAAKVVGRSQIGAPVLLSSVQYRVSYSDLELSIPSNAKAFKARVRDAARDACADLGKLYPISAGSSDECARKAEEGVTPLVESAIAAAEARKTAAD